MDWICDSSLTSSSEEYFGGKVFDKSALWKSHLCPLSSVHKVDSQTFAQTVQGLTWFPASCLCHCKAEVILVSMISPRFTSSFVGSRLINSHLETPKMLLLFEYMINNIIRKYYVPSICIWMRILEKAEIKIVILVFLRSSIGFSVYFMITKPLHSPQVAIQLCFPLTPD